MEGAQNGDKKRINVGLADPHTDSGYCRGCGEWGPVDDGLLRCCQSPLKPNTAYITPPGWVRARVLFLQDYKCGYCGAQFGSENRNALSGRKYLVQIEWDHFVPRSAGAPVGWSNIVAACPICNHTKANVVFEDISTCRLHVRREHKRAGYPLYEPPDIQFEDRPEVDAGGLGVVMCEYQPCGVRFERRRAFQRFCCANHRNRWHNDELKKMAERGRTARA